jgi:sugar transferase (PEP-CTERM/EpsH1 system associated)
MEHMLVTLINRLPEERYRHAIITLTDATEFRSRIAKPDVPILELHKQAGQDPASYLRLWRVLRSLRPDILHTRNLPALDAQFLAAAARIPGRIHGEHGRDTYDLDGTNFGYNLLRRGVRPFVDCYIAVSRDLASWLVGTVGARPHRVRQIYNGVDTSLYRPRSGPRPPIGPDGFCSDDSLLIGTVGRLAAVKDQPALIRAFAHLREIRPALRSRLRLVIAGDGPLREECLRVLQETGASDACWLTGERSDIAALLPSFDLFVLPSLAEGVSNTLLEAMSCGLPSVVTSVGGNVELVENGQTGLLTPPGDSRQMASILATAFDQPGVLHRIGLAAREAALARFSLHAMVEAYASVYDQVLSGKPPSP